MNSLTEQIDAVISAEHLPWERAGKLVDVELWAKGRRQKVHLERRGEMYRFWSIVAGAEFVTRDEGAWRDLAYRAWRKNDLKEIVTFSFDRRHRLIGVIEQPAETLDREELVLYISTLARECDRFEYKLLGRDRE
jgi:hypothetical protein